MKTWRRVALRSSSAHRDQEAQHGAFLASEVVHRMREETAQETISAIAEKLRLLGCTEQQIDKHVTSLRGALKLKKHRLKALRH
jgi:predicted transcriptional regulator